MATIRFFTKTTTKKKNVLVNIYVRLRSGRNIDYTAKADILIKPENWSNHTQQARQKADLFKFKTGGSIDEKKGRQNFNTDVTELRKTIETKLMEARQADISASWLKKVIDEHWNPDKYKTTLYSYITTFIEKAKTKPNQQTGRPVGYRMQREYQVTFDYLKEFGKSLKRESDFKDIDHEFYDGFIQYLQDEELAVNTIGKKIQTLKTFLNAATEEGVNNFEYYKSKKFKKLSEEADTIYLNEQELEQIYKHDFSDTPHLDRVRDMFLLGCWTGCRFSDFTQITPENISDNLIHVRQEKTEQKVLIPLHPVVAAILEKYEGKLPAPISNQKFNGYIKDVAELAKINDKVHKSITKGGVRKSKQFEKHQLVSTHTARRSFATNLYKSGFPSISIMAITGHKTEESFLKYIKVTPDEHAKKLQEHWGNQHLKVV